MAERPEDLSLPASVVARIIKEAVRALYLHEPANKCIFYIYPSIFHA